MRLIRVFAILTGVVYLGWRLGFTWQGANPFLFALLWIAECFGLLRVAVELTLIGDGELPEKAVEPGPTVPTDIILVVTDEPTSEVRAAILSARLVRGMASVTVVDRDDRPEINLLAIRLDIPRIAGGLHPDLGALVNEALRKGNAPLVILFEADTIVLPDFVELAASSFADPEIGLMIGRVDVTNAARNLDHDGYGETTMREQLVRPRLDAAHALPWWSAPTALRRQAIEQVGGMASGSSLTTLVTGLRLHVTGWRTADLPVVVARRLSRNNDERQLHEWSRQFIDRLSVLVRDDVSWRSSRFTPLARLAYWSALIDAFRSLQRVALIFVLLCTLLTGALPLVAPGLVFVAGWVAVMGLRLMARLEATRPTGFRVWITNDIGLLTTELSAWFKFFRGDKGRADLLDSAPGDRSRSVLLVVTQLMLLVASGRYILGFGRPPIGDLAMLLVLITSIWTMLVIAYAGQKPKLRQGRAGYRARAPLPTFMSSIELQVTGVSPFGINIDTAEAIHENMPVRVIFGLPQADGIPIRFEANTHVKRIDHGTGGRRSAYLQFAQLSDEEMDQIYEYCAVVGGLVELRAEPDVNLVLDVGFLGVPIEDEALDSGSAESETDIDTETDDDADDDGDDDDAELRGMTTVPLP